MENVSKPILDKYFFFFGDNMKIPLEISLHAVVKQSKSNALVLRILFVYILFLPFATIQIMLISAP